MRAIPFVVFAMSLAIPCAVAGQVPPAPGAAVAGTVTDSTTARPLAGARVLLWGTTHEARTDEEGRFHIPGLPPGEYSLVFFHPRLAELGIASGGRPVRVGREDVDVDLAIPSRFTILSATCAGAGGVTAAGQVSDGASGLPLGGVRVGFRWPAGGEEPGGLTVETDGEGWYHACDVPPDRPVAVTASFLDRQAHRREILAPEGAAVRLDLALALLRSSRVSTTVVESGSDRPVADAVVRLGVSGGPRRAETDGDGRVTFQDVPPGRYTLEVDHLAHAARTDSVDVPSGMVVAVRVQVSPRPIPLPPLDVTVEGFEETLGLMGGIEITAAEVEAVRARSRDLGDLLHNQHIPGVIVKRGFGGEVCVEFLTGQVRMFKRTCEPVMVILDGVRMGTARDLFAMPATVIEHMRLFRPVEAGTLFGLGSGAGVLVITTKARN